MRMRGGAGPSHSDDQFRPDYRGGYGDRAMRGRGMRGHRGGMDDFRGDFVHSLDNQDNSDPPIISGSSRGGRGFRGDYSGRGRERVNSNNGD